ncbi:MAG: response regulator, partial [Anaerolineales bacterium]|nr:response regulator [Anaerolineales bacterium]
GLEISREGDHAIRFSVWDTGIGIQADQLEKLFKPFVQLDSSLSRQYTGTGLGLALTRQLADLHGGSVGVESEAGKGSRFHFIIPIQSLNAKTLEDTAREPSAQQKPVKTRASQQVDKKRILLVEDNAINMMVSNDYLSANGYHVDTATNGFEAIESAQTHKPDLILMDIQMPGMNGLEAIKRLRATPGFDSIPIIALTALAMPGDRERCLEAGADEYLAKPVSLKKLEEIIENLLR